LEVLHSTKEEPATPHQDDCLVLNHVMTLLIQHGSGAMANGKRSILGCSIKLSEAEHYWRKFLQSLLDCGTVTRYQKSAPGLAGWLEGNVPEAITVFSFPPGQRRRLRTNHGLERLNKEIKRHTRVATLFPNEASLLRLVSEVLSEISNDWENERFYLNMEAR
jgi:transposase-like protein